MLPFFFWKKKQFEVETYECNDCKIQFKHYDSVLGHVKCPYCGSSNVKVIVITVNEDKLENGTSYNRVDKIVNAAIVLFILAFVGRLGLIQLFQASTTSISSTLITMITILIGIMFALGVALAFYRYLVKD